MKKYFSPKFIEVIAYTVLFAGTLICGVHYLERMRYYFMDDSLSYISIAKLYASGNFFDAINSHWSPLFSWLMVPFVWLKCDLLFWGKIIVIISILPSLWFTKKFSDELGVNKILTWFLCATVSVILLHPALFNFTPDVLVVPSLLFITLQIIREAKIPLSSSHIQLAIAAALGFYVKQYMVFFFIALILLLKIIQFASHPNISKKITQSFLKIISFFFLFLLPWILMVSWKEKKFCITTTTDYNISLLNMPEQPLNTYLKRGLISLPYSSAYSYWDEPSSLHFTHYSIANELTDTAHRKFLLNNIHNNYNTFFDFVDFMFGFRALIILIPLLIFSIYFLWKKNENSKNYFSLFAIILIYSSGYIFLVSDYRYIYFDIVLLAIVAMKTLSDAIPKNIPAFIFLLSGISFAYVFGKMSFDKIKEFYDEGKHKTEWVKNVSSELKKNSRICNFNSEEMPAQLIYENDLKYFGVLNSEQSLLFQLNELSKFKIEYVCSNNAITDSLKNFLSPVIENSDGVWIYRVGNKTEDRNR